MTYLKLSWEEDLKLKVRFLELIFLIAAILAGLNAAELKGITGGAMLVFILCVTIHYFILANAILADRLIIVAAFLTSFSFSAVYSGIFTQLDQLSILQSVFYWLLPGFLVGLGLLPRKTIPPVISRMPFTRS